MFDERILLVVCPYSMPRTVPPLLRTVSIERVIFPTSIKNKIKKIGTLPRENFVSYFYFAIYRAIHTSLCGENEIALNRTSEMLKFIS